tara:strand:+ start:104 stop:319 length:216 start_codon:yes stop_codon:yes gene_type:complete
MSKKQKLTRDLLTRIIAEEKQKLIDLGLLSEENTLEENYKKLTAQEARLRKKLSEVKNLRRKIKNKLNKRS